MQGKVPSAPGTPAPVYVGIDVSKAQLEVYLHPHGQRCSFTNDRDGLRQLERRLAGHEIAGLVMEATGKYHRLAQRLLGQAGFAVAVVDPRRARLFAEAIGRRAKTDPVDAEMLAQLGAMLQPEPTPPAAAELQALQELVHAQSAASAERTALVNRLQASETDFLRGELKRRLRSLDGHIERLKRRIAQQIAAQPAFARRYAILASIPGIGPFVAASLIADLPELGRLDRHAAACLAGLAPFADDSGNREGPRHIKGGRAQPRRALYLAALSAMRYHPDLAPFYRRLCENGKKPKVALVAVMRKLVILANTLIREDRTWTPIHA